MASMGLKYLAWAKMATEPAASVPTYDTGEVLGKAVSTNLAITNSEGELYADDMLAEYVSEFASAILTAEADNITLDKQAHMYGATYSDNELQLNASDNAPYGGIGGYQVVMINGVRKYRAWFFAKGRASVPDWSGATKGGSITFGNQPIKMKLMAPNYGPWYYVKEFTTEAAAKAYIDTKLNVATWYSMNVQVQGAGSGEAATPIGVTSVASAGTFELVVTGTPTALYDNGAESKASISGGKYTLSNVAADHEIAVIF